MNKKILQLAIPNIISNISIPMLGIVDMALMGHLDSDAYIGAITLGLLIFNFIYWGLGFLRMGTSGFTAQAWGRRDLPETILVFSRAAFIALVLSILLLILQKPIEMLSFLVLQGETQVEKLAMDYFRIRVWAAPAALGQFALLGFFLGMQNARLPMVVLSGHHTVDQAQEFPAGKQGYLYPYHVSCDCLFHIYCTVGQLRSVVGGRRDHPCSQFASYAILHVFFLSDRWICPCLRSPDG